MPTPTKGVAFETPPDHHTWIVDGTLIFLCLVDPWQREKERHH